ncbi:hypothetical protein ACEQ8H_005343 [Pleosporales sp. CAS-2024a]
MRAFDIPELEHPLPVVGGLVMPVPVPDDHARPAVPVQGQGHGISLRALDQFILIAMRQHDPPPIAPPVAAKPAPNRRHPVVVPVVAVVSKRAGHDTRVHVSNVLGRIMIAQQQGQTIDSGT